MAEEERSPAERVPFEIVIRILQHLPPFDAKNARLVNSLWYEASKNKKILKKQKFTFDSKIHEKQLSLILDMLEDAGYRYYNLEFHNEHFHDILNRFLDFIKSNSKYIYSLTFIDCSFPFVMLEEVMILCHNLTEISFERCDCTDSTEATVIPNLKEKIVNLNLISLRVVECYWMKENVFNIFVDIYPNLKRMQFSEMNLLSSTNNNYHYDEFPFTKLCYESGYDFANLESLNVNRPSRQRFDDDLFIEFGSQPGLRLKELHIEYHVEIGTYVFEQSKSSIDIFLSKQHYLKVLDVKYIDRFTFGSLQYLFDECPDIECLKFSSRWSSFEEIERNFHLLAESKLKTLEIQSFIYPKHDVKFPKFRRNCNMQRLVIQGYKSVGNTILVTMLRTFSNLTYLDLSFSEVSGSRRELVKIIFQDQTQLKTLKLNGCFWIGDTAFKRCNLPNLEQLDLTECRVSVAGLVKIYAPKLKWLSLMKCARIVEDVIAISKMFPLLQYLNLNGTKLEEKIILKACENLKFLKYISIKKRNKPPVLDIETVSQYCPSLRFIEMGKLNSANLYVYNYLEKKWISYNYDDTLFQRGWWRYQCLGVFGRFSNI